MIPSRQHTPLSACAAFNKAAALCSRAEQAPADIRAKLLGWGLSADDADSVLQQLRTEGFLSEARYAHAFCHDKVKFNGWGRVKIAFTLKNKGIGAAHIDAALEDIDDAQYRANLQQLLNAKMRDLKGKSPLQAKAALLRFATQRGYEPNLTYSLIDNILAP